MSKKVQKHPKKEVPVYPDQPAFNYILAGLFLIFIVLFTTFKISGDDDVFWHLATGRYIVQTGHVPSTDIFGFVSEGQEWMPFEWGWDVLTYGIYSVSSYAGISILRTLIFVTVFSLLFLLLRKFKVSYTLIFLFLGILAFGMIDRLTPRPHIMSYLFLSILIYIIINYRYFKRENYKALYFIPGIFLLWANFHMGILAGLLLFFIYTVSEWIIYFYPHKFTTKELPAFTKQELMRLSVIFILSGVVMLINPNFLATYLYALSHTKMKLLESINEWKSPFDSMFSGFVPNIYKGLLAGGVIILYYSVKKKDLFAGLVYLVFAYYSTKAVRFTVDYMLITFTFLVVSFSYIIVNLKSSFVKNFISKSPVPKIAISIFLIYFIINLPNDNLYLKILEYYRISGFGINSDFIPEQMFDFIKQNGIQDKGKHILNHFGTGGYFIWNFPGKQNFIDSRNLNDSVFNEYNQIIAKMPGFEKKLDKYDIDYSMYLAPDLTKDPTEMEKTIISYFSKSSNWKLVFWDDKSFLFVKDTPAFKDVIEKYEYKYLTPYNLAYRRGEIEKGIAGDKEEIKKELQRKLSEEPAGFLINNIRSAFGNKIL